MFSLIFALLISHLSFSSAQNYYGCYNYYYASNGTLCCNKRINSNYYYYYYGYTYYTSYCPYITASPSTTSTTPSASCLSYYYSYYYSSTCCYKTVGSYSPYYTYPYYYYTTSDCHLSSTTSRPIYANQCQYTYYNSYYTTDCCTFLNSYNYGYTQYCPTASSLSGQCYSSSCCTVNVPVKNGSSTFYYTTYHCPSSTTNTICGPNCFMAIVFGIVGCCCCMFGLGFSISALVLAGLLFREKFEKQNKKLKKSKYVMTRRYDEVMHDPTEIEQRQGTHIEQSNQGSVCSNEHRDVTAYPPPPAQLLSVRATAPDHAEVKVNL